MFKLFSKTKKEDDSYVCCDMESKGTFQDSRSLKLSSRERLDQLNLL